MAELGGPRPRKRHSVGMATAMTAEETAHDRPPGTPRNYDSRMSLDAGRENPESPLRLSSRSRMGRRRPLSDSDTMAALEEGARSAADEDKGDDGMDVEEGGNARGPLGSALAASAGGSGEFPRTAESGDVSSAAVADFLDGEVLARPLNEAPAASPHFPHLAGSASFGGASTGRIHDLEMPAAAPSASAVAPCSDLRHSRSRSIPRGNPLLHPSQSGADPGGNPLLHPSRSRADPSGNPLLRPSRSRADPSSNPLGNANRAADFAPGLGNAGLSPAPAAWSAVVVPSDPRHLGIALATPGQAYASVPLTIGVSSIQPTFSNFLSQEQTQAGLGANLHATSSALLPDGGGVLWFGDHSALAHLSGGGAFPSAAGHALAGHAPAGVTLVVQQQQQDAAAAALVDTTAGWPAAAVTAGSPHVLPWMQAHPGGAAVAAGGGGVAGGTARPPSAPAVVVGVGSRAWPAAATPSSWDDDDAASFDGKRSPVSAMEPRTEDERRLSRAIHGAAEADDGLMMASILRTCPATPRMLLDRFSGPPFTGDVPAHVAAKKGNQTALNYLLGADRVCVLIRNRLGHTALHCAVLHGHFAAVQAICARTPASARVQCEEGYLPLHDAMSSGARHQDAPQIAAVLLGAFPGAVNITTDEGLLPIHLAAMSGFSAGIRTIFGYNFETLTAKENTKMMLAVDFATDGLAVCTGGRDGMEVPISDATQPAPNGGAAGSNIAEVQHEVLSVARQQPPTFSTTEDFEACIEILLMSTLYSRPIPAPQDESDDWPFLPIHAAICARPLPRTWQFIFSYYGNHAADTSNDEQAPLHYLAITAPRDDESNVAMINYLNSLYPDSASLRDRDGFLPIHHALLNPSTSQGMIKALLDCYGAAATVEIPRNSTIHRRCRGFLPFQIAAATGLGANVIYMLLRTHPMGVKNGIRRLIRRST